MKLLMCEMLGVGIAFKRTVAVRRLFRVVLKVSGIQKQSVKDKLQSL